MPLPRRVLVVEDQMLIAMMVEDMLSDMGVETVGPAADIGTAIRLAGEADLDFALLDVNLDGHTSFPAAEILLARGIPFAFLTGYGSPGVRTDLRVHPVLSKPVDPLILQEVLNGVSNGRQRARPN